MSCASTHPGARPSTPTGCSRRTRHPRSSPSCTQRPRRGCATTSSRSGEERARRCSWSTWSRRSAASRSRSTTGPSTSRTAAPRSASACHPGLSPLTVSPRALERMLERPPSWYLDLNLLARYVQDGSGGGRVYHHTAPVSMVAALHAGLGVLLEEGIAEVQQRHAECGKELQAGLEALGLELLVEPGHRLPQLTTVKVPDGTDDAACRRRLLSGVRDRDRGRRRPVGGADLADRLHGQHGAPAERRDAARRAEGGVGLGERGQGGPARAARAARPAGLAALAHRGRLPRLARGADPLRRLALALGAPAQGRARALRGPARASPRAVASGSASGISAPATASGSSSASASRAR